MPPSSCRWSLTRHRRPDVDGRFPDWAGAGESAESCRAAPSYKTARIPPMGAGCAGIYSARSKRPSIHRVPKEPDMAAPKDLSNVQQLPWAHHEPMALDAVAIENARRSAAAPAAGADEALWRKGLIKLLNDALATELVCVLRYKRHHYTAHGLASPRVADEFAVHAAEEMVHADRLARRIVQLGGEPDFAPDSLSRRSHAEYDESTALKAMMQSNLSAERAAIEAYGQLVRLVGDRDPSTRRLFEDLLADEQRHAEELLGWLTE
jgi:bacterioferritin